MSDVFEGIWFDGQSGHRLCDCGREGHDLSEERVLRAVEPRDEGNVDAGRGCDPAQRGAVVADTVVTDSLTEVYLTKRKRRLADRLAIKSDRVPNAPKT